MQTLRVCLLGSVVVMLSACPARTPQGAVPQAHAVTDDGTRVRTLMAERTAAGVRTEPCLGPGDLLEISVFHWPDLQGFKTRVSPTGTITLPLLGQVQAAGLTDTELRDRIAEGLRHGYMRDPQVSVFVDEYVSQQVSVTGAVARPGLYGLSRDHRTVSDLISEAGGFDEHAGGRISLYPGPKGSACGASARPALEGATNVEPVEIDVNDEYTTPADNPLLLPVHGGDSIVVNRGRFLVDGWVNKPGAYDIAPGTTALGGVSAAGGAVYAADLSRIAVWRMQRGGTKKKIEVDMDAVEKGEAKDVTLQAGDVVDVPASTLRMIPYSAYWMLTTVVRVGAGVSIPLF